MAIKTELNNVTGKGLKFKGNKHADFILIRLGT